jgi:putative endonuclease
MFYVYLIRSTAKPGKTYVGMTEALEARIARHNAGAVPATARFAPWDLVAFVAVREHNRAIQLERYFKSGSGHAFARKHLW